MQFFNCLEYLSSISYLFVKLSSLLCSDLFCNIVPNIASTDWDLLLFYNLFLYRPKFNKHTTYVSQTTTVEISENVLPQKNMYYPLFQPQYNLPCHHFLIAKEK